MSPSPMPRYLLIQYLPSLIGIIDRTHPAEYRSTLSGPASIVGTNDGRKKLSKLSKRRVDIVKSNGLYSDSDGL